MDWELVWLLSGMEERKKKKRTTTFLHSINSEWRDNCWKFKSVHRKRSVLKRKKEEKWIAHNKLELFVLARVFQTLACGRCASSPQNHSFHENYFNFNFYFVFFFIHSIFQNVTFFIITQASSAIHTQTISLEHNLLTICKYTFVWCFFSLFFSLLFFCCFSLSPSYEFHWNKLYCRTVVFLYSVFACRIVSRMHVENSSIYT